jgi:tRNA G18 (ribose-2'-O)-methylase SpoU
MAELVTISDPTDPRLGDYAALTDAALRKRYEHEAGILVAEGPNPVRELVTSPYPVRSFLIADERLTAMAPVLDASRAPAYVVSRETLYEVVRFRLHQGVIACAARLPNPSPGTVVSRTDRVAVLEGLNDHENLGALFRSARGLGVGGVLLGAGCADPLYRRSVRVSMGHVLHVPHARVTGLDEAFAALGANGFRTVALSPDPRASDLRDLEVEVGQRVAVLLGAEGPGLSEEAIGRADVLARIPMHGGVDSLNVATAGAIAFHALARR